MPSWPETVNLTIILFGSKSLCVIQGQSPNFLNREPKIEGFVLLEIARRSYPDFIPNDVGTDPWATATRNISGRLDEPEQQYLAGVICLLGRSGIDRGRKSRPHRIFI